MIQRLIAFLLLQWLLMAGFAHAETAKPAVAKSPTAAPAASSPLKVIQPKKTPQEQYLDGLACLKKSDAACVQLAQASIPSISPYAKLLSAQIAASRGDFDTAFRLLLPLQAESGLVPEANASLHATLALAYENQQDTLRALEQHVLAEPDLSESETEADQQKIWQLLTSQSKQQLIEMRGESPDNIVQGWIDLALAASSSASPKKAIESWRRTYPEHPALAALLLQASNSNNAQTVATLEGKVALLLPFEVEAYSAAAVAIRHGFEAAQAVAQGHAEVKAYAANGDKDQIIAIYQQAVADGAQSVVGPLTRDEVGALAGVTLPVPTLVLNQSEDIKAQSDLHMLGLSIETEAAQIVKIARDYGMQSAIVISAATPLAAHMVEAFSAAWIAEGGQITLQASFPEGSNFADLKAQTTAHPADMIFLAADAIQARAIRSYLDSATPTFGLSHIYGGNAKDPLDEALSAIHFVDIPWLLNPDDPEFAPYRNAAADLPPGETQRWFALGVDAYHILAALKKQPHAPLLLHGLSGKIRLDEQGNLQRELALGQFRQDGVALEKAP